MQLFRGCVTDIFEGDALDAAARLLGHAGLTVTMPSGQTCCGALSQHGGDLAEARRCARENVSALGGSESISCVASGCAVALSDYEELVGDSGRQLADRLVEIPKLLLASGRPLRFSPLALQATFHTPCTLRNRLGGATDWLALLRKIPGLELAELPAGHGCCGAAGTYFLTKPKVADELASDLLAPLRSSPAQVLLSPNIGCSLHISAALRRDGMAISVRHPLVLLAEQLSAEG